MNILIAIVSATYERITLRRNAYALMQRTAIYADYIQLVRPDKMINSRYLYVITPVKESI